MSTVGKIVFASKSTEHQKLIRDILAPLEIDFNAYDDLWKLGVAMGREKPNVMLIDFDSFRQDGYQFCKTLKEEALPDLPIIMVTSVDISDQLKRMAEQNRVDYLMNRMSILSELPDRIKSLIMAEEKEPECVFDDIEEFTYKGDITKSPLPRIFYHIKKDSKTGLLPVSKNNLKKVVSFESGSPKSSISNIISECLGQMLVSMNRITDGECQKSLELMREQKIKQGEALVKMSVLNPHEVATYLKIQAKERMINLFGWKDGRYEFMSDRTIKEDLPPIEDGAPEIVLAGVKRHYTLETLKKFMDKWFSLIPHYDTNPVIKVEDFKLGTWDTKTSRLFDGKRTLKEIIDQRKVRELDLYTLLFAFYSLGVLKFKESSDIFPEHFDRKYRHRFTTVNKSNIEEFKDSIYFNTTALKEDHKKVEKHKPFLSSLNTAREKGEKRRPTIDLRSALRIVAYLVFAAFAIYAISSITTTKEDLNKPLDIRKLIDTESIKSFRTQGTTIDLICEDAWNLNREKDITRESLKTNYLKLKEAGIKEVRLSDPSGNLLGQVLTDPKGEYHIIVF